MIKVVKFSNKQEFLSGTVVGFLEEHHMFSPYTPEFMFVNLGVSF
jgi:hypothetical protein